jgi:uncharacterized protein YqjF (DUF2071 family)
MKSLQEQQPPLLAGTYPALPPVPVERPVLLHTWSELSFVHWPYDPAAIQALLPDTLAVDVLDDVAWVGLVPFHCTIRPRGIPRVPWVSSFEEMNVRTYVRGPDGVPGVWFITLDAARLGAVLIARITYGLRYFWSKMAFTRVGDVATYSSRRRWPTPSKVVGTVALEVGSPIAPDEVTPLEDFLTGRWSFYGCLGGRLYRGQIEHAPWELERAHLLHCDAGLLTACGLPKPHGDPILHHSRRSVEVRMSGPKRLPRAARPLRF